MVASNFNSFYSFRFIKYFSHTEKEYRVLHKDPLAYKQKPCRFLEKLNRELPHDLAIPLLGMGPKGLKAESPVDTRTLMLIAASFTAAKRRTTPMSIHRWTEMDVWHIHTMGS